MEKRIEELEVRLRIAEAKADLAIKMVAFLCDELGRSGVIAWGANDLKRLFLDHTDYKGAAAELARLEIVPSPDESTSGEVGAADIRRFKTEVRLREQILIQIRREYGYPR